MRQAERDDVILMSPANDDKALFEEAQKKVFEDMTKKGIGIRRAMKVRWVLT